MDAEGRIYGIDLGTTYSAIAYVNDFGVPKIVPNAEGHRSTPSVICFDGDQVIVGAKAVERSTAYPEDTVRFVKRYVGQPGYKFRHTSGEFTVEELSSFILRKVVRDAEKRLGTQIKDVVITCPAYFGINERESTKIAGEIAGLNVRQIINEPTAAAITYGATEIDEPQLVLVYDLGGGTFDITMIEIRPESIKVISTGGDPRLGGKDWDDRLKEHLAREFPKYAGADVDAEEILSDLYMESELALLAEKAKIDLCANQKAEVSFTYMGDRAVIPVTFDTFAHITRDILDKTIRLTGDMLEAAQRKGYYKFDQILLVGGSTHMPQIARRLRAEFELEPKFFHPEESVAKGAAIYGWKLFLRDRLVERIAAKQEEKQAPLTMDLGAFSENLEKVVRKVATRKPSLEDLLEGAALELDLDRPGYATEKDARTTDAMRELERELEDIEVGAITQADIQDAVAEVSFLTGFKARAVKNSMMEILDIASKSFGIAAKDKKGRPGVSIIVTRNSTVPVKAQKTFYTVSDNQKGVNIRIMESETHHTRVGEDEAVPIGNAKLRFPKGLPKNTPVDISFSLNREGRLHMTATERTHGKSVELVVETASVISAEELERAKSRRERISVR
ncbi:MAG: Hsp70 family protein [Deltaproteobacteria bacterium]|nr:Hsp70 family protein [Deltaproteobacteria bacterium]